MIEIIAAKQHSELDICRKIRRTVFIEEKNVPEEIEVDGYDTIGGDCIHFLAVSDSVPIGAFRCLNTGGGTVRLQRFCILPEFREKGAGRIVLELLERYCRDIGISRIEMDAKFDVAEFYEKCGYFRISDKFIEAGIPHIKMTKELLTYSNHGRKVE